MTLDQAALLAYLDQRADIRSPVVGAIFEALATRIRRGDFDEKEVLADGVVQGR